MTTPPTPSQPSPRLLLLFAILSGLALLLYIGIGFGLNIHQQHMQERILKLQAGTTREAVLNAFGEPDYRELDNSEWHYTFSKAPEEFRPHPRTLYVKFSPKGRVTETGALDES